MIRQHATNPTTILVVEDDAGDRELIERALQRENFAPDMRFVGDGEEALQYLRREGCFQDPSWSPTPDMILLDLNMPKLDGRGFLERLRADEKLKHLVVVVLTTSDQDVDILKAYQLNCQSYLTKPDDPGRFIRTIRHFGEYWFQLVSLPLRQ